MHENDCLGAENFCFSLDCNNKTCKKEINFKIFIKFLILRRWLLFARPTGIKSRMARNLRTDGCFDLPVGFVQSPEWNKYQRVAQSDGQRNGQSDGNRRSVLDYYCADLFAWGWLLLWGGCVCGQCDLQCFIN